VTSAALIAGVIIGSYEFRSGLDSRNIASNSLQSSGLQSLPMSPVVASEDELKDYSIEPFLVARNSETDEVYEDSESKHSAQLPPSTQSNTQNPARHYVLDPVPALASYERTIY
jgi:hypothetical protein